VVVIGRRLHHGRGSNHHAEIDEALGLATSRWHQLLAVEQQVIRDEQALAIRPKQRPSQLGDETLSDRTLEQRNAGWQEETKHRRASLADLKEQAKRKRRELEALKTRS
jgi:hypothetical protein